MPNPQPYFRKLDSWWYVQTTNPEGKRRQVKLVKGLDQKAAAFERFYQLMAQKDPASVEDRSQVNVASYCDLFLEWQQKHHSANTYDWCQSSGFEKRLQARYLSLTESRSLPPSMLLIALWHKFPGVGYPEDLQLGLKPAASPLAESLRLPPRRSTLLARWDGFQGRRRLSTESGSGLETTLGTSINARPELDCYSVHIC